MLNVKKIILATAAAGMLVSFAGCKKADNANNKGDNAVQQLAQTVEEAVAAPAEWKKEDVNALLTFVPEDTMMVVASTREIDINHPYVQKIFSIYAGYPKAIHDLANAETDQDAKKVFNELAGVVDGLGDLLKDYKGHAAEFGLNPEGHHDTVAYVDGSLIVVKESLDDSAKAKSKLDAILKTEIISKAFKIEDFKAGASTWTKYKLSDESNDIQNGALQDLKTKRDEAVKANDTDAVARYNETIANLEKSAEATSGISFALNYDNNILTVAIALDETDAANYERTLKPASKPLDKSALGKVEPNVIMLGYMDNVKGLSKLLSGKTREAVQDLLGAPLEPACDGELKTIAEDYPRINFISRVNGNDTMIMDSTLVFKDKDALKKIQSLHAPSLGIFGDDTQIGLKLNIDLNVLYNQILALVDTISNKTYQCSMLSSLSGAAKEVPAMLTSPEVSMYKNMIVGISGLNVAINKLNMDGEIPQIEGVANLTGANLATTLGSLMPLFGMKMPALLKLKAGGEPVEIDLTEAADMPLKLNAILTQTDLVAATPSHDVKAIASKDRVPGTNFLEIRLDSEFYNSIAKGTSGLDPNQQKAIFDFYSSMKSQTTMSIGTNDEGLVGSSVVIFK